MVVFVPRHAGEVEGAGASTAAHDLGEIPSEEEGEDGGPYHRTHDHTQRLQKEV